MLYSVTMLPMESASKYLTYGVVAGAAREIMEQMEAITDYWMEVALKCLKGAKFVLLFWGGQRVCNWVVFNQIHCCLVLNWVSNFPRWDHETINENTTFVRGNGSLYSAKKSEGEFSRQKTPIQFTAEIMRLLAARWREAGGPPSIQKSKKRRGRPRKFL